MFKKSLFLTAIFYLLLLFPLRANAWQTNHIVSLPLTFIDNFVNYQNDIYLLINGEVKKWDKTKETWENFTTGLPKTKVLLGEEIEMLGYRLSSVKDKLLLSSNIGIFKYNPDKKKWETFGKLDPEIDSWAVSFSQNHWVALGNDFNTQNYRPLYLNEKEEWVALPSSNSLSKQTHFWGLSKDWFIQSDDNKIYGYTFEQGHWDDITANLSNYLKTKEDIVELQVEEKNAWVIVKGKGIFRKSLSEKDWTLYNNGINSSEQAITFSDHYEDFYLFTNKNVYQFNSSKNTWEMLPEFKNKGVRNFLQLGKQKFARTEESILLFDKSGFKPIHEGLLSSNYFSLQKFKDQFYLASQSTLMAFNPKENEWVNYSNQMSPCGYSPDSFLIDQDKLWITTGRGGIFSMDQFNQFKNYSKGLLSIPYNDKDCPHLYEPILSVQRLSNQTIAISPESAYRFNETNQKFQKIFSVYAKNEKRPAPKTNEDLDLSCEKNPARICCSTQLANKIYIGTLKGLYEYDGLAFKKIPVASKEIDSSATLLASSPTKLAVLSNSQSVYLYNLANKEWEYLPGEIDGFIKLVFLGEKLFALSATKIYFWNENYRDWENIKELSLKKLTGKEPQAYLHSQKDEGRLIHSDFEDEYSDDIEEELPLSPSYIDLITEAGNLYLLSSEGIYELKP